MSAILVLIDLFLFGVDLGEGVGQPCIWGGRGWERADYVLAMVLVASLPLA